MTLHLVRRPADDPAGPEARVGFVVSKAVGNAVERHRTQRRLRHIARDHLGRLPSGGDLVVRARPEALSAGTDELDQEFDRLLTRALRGLDGAGPRSAA